MNQETLSTPSTTSEARAEHTPTPWELKCEDAINRIFQKGEKDGWHIATLNLNDSYDRLNGEFICRAVNSHHELLAACKLALTMECPKDKMGAMIHNGLMITLKEAISKAQGQS